LKKTQILKELNNFKKWTKDNGRTRHADWNARNIAVGCIQTINQCGQSANAWLDRKPGRRSRIKRIADTYDTRDGARELRRLIDYAISVVGATSWVNDFWLGALPVKREPKQTTARDRERMRRANATRQARKQQESAAWEEAKKKATFRRVGTIIPVLLKWPKNARVASEFLMLSSHFHVSVVPPKVDIRGRWRHDSLAKQRWTSFGSSR